MQHNCGKNMQSRSWGRLGNGQGWAQHKEHDIDNVQTTPKGLRTCANGLLVNSQMGGLCIDEADSTIGLQQLFARNGQNSCYLK